MQVSDEPVSTLVVGLVYGRIVRCLMSVVVQRRHLHIHSQQPTPKNTQHENAQELVVRGEGEAVDVGVVRVGAAVLGRLGRLARVPDGQALLALLLWLVLF